jgi:hypothetical protein
MLPNDEALWLTKHRFTHPARLLNWKKARR